jgi:hemolysin activation/secretion protein
MFKGQFFKRMAVILLMEMLISSVVLAQRAPLTKGPGETRPELPTLEQPKGTSRKILPPITLPELPTFEPPKRTPGTILPPIPLPEKPDMKGLSGGLKVFIRDILITGNTVLSLKELGAITAPYKEKILSFADLEKLRDEITFAYVNRGFVSSGAVIPDQSIQNDIVEIRIVEGTLGEVELETDGRLKERYLRSRLRPVTSGVVNVNEIEEALQILQQNPRIRSVKAALVPREIQGESLLRVFVSEADPASAVLQLDNHESPSVGSERALIDFTHLNVSGLGDSLSFTGRSTRGLRGVEAMYEIPLNSLNTTLDLHVDVARSDVIEEPFEELDIESRSETYGFTIAHPIHHSLRSRLQVFLTGEKRRTQSFLLGSGFPFAEGLSEDGVAKVSVVRFGQTWTYQGRQNALALRNTLSIGLDLLGATVNEGNIPDGQFVAWLGQLQWAHRLQFWGISGQIIFRADAQLTDSALLGMEKFAVGGHDTVRGYRENEFVRDNGLIGSLELRIPVFTSADGGSVLVLAPFFDIGRSWDKNAPSDDDETISSAGLGIRWRTNGRVQAQIYWGYSFNDIDRIEESNIQDDGFHMQISLSFP